MFLAIEPAVVSSLCPLLSAEVAEDYLPGGFMKIPSRSAWIPLQVNIADFAGSSGQLDERDLTAALCNCVDEGERRHDCTDWADAELEHDSWRNRRLAIALRGWGDLVARRGDDPRDLQTLRDMERLAHWCCETIQRHSRLLARQSRWCPALDDAGAQLKRSEGAIFWRARWNKALSEVAVRHRNLTTISPWDVFVQHGSADLDYIDLLPLLRFADSVSFQCNVSIAHWNSNEFKSFCERLTAVVRSGRGQGCVAEQV